jgi:DNA-binding CsgD family transcriptional regulator
MMRKLEAHPIGGIVSATHEELVVKAEWDGSAWVNEARAARVDHFVGSMRPLALQGSEGVGLMRETGDRPFSEEDREVLHLVRYGAGALFPAESRGVAHLSDREREIVGRALRGCNNKVIANDLGLAHSTVKVLMARAATKLGARSRDELVEKARRLGLEK